MSKEILADPRSADVRQRPLMRELARVAATVPPGTCPLETQMALLRAARAQTCGKCTPCRAGLVQLEAMLDSLLRGEALPETPDAMRALASSIADSADCAIGFSAASAVLDGLDAFSAEYQAHAQYGACDSCAGQEIPCVHECPAHVDVPGYIALVGEGSYAEAINLIRRDNPLPTACAMICEHPCEERCRRTLLDAPLNIRGLKKFAVDQVRANSVATPAAHAATGKKVAVIGGGPAGLTAAYYLALMGHAVSLYERQEQARRHAALRHSQLPFSQKTP